MPQIKQQMEQTMEKAQKAMEQIDMKKVSNKIQQGVQLIKKKIENLKKSSKNNELAITVNNKEASKQISQIQKEIDSLQEKINSRQMKLDFDNSALDKIRNDTLWGVKRENPDISNEKLKNKAYQRMNNNSTFTSLVKESDKLNKEIEKYTALLESAKQKQTQLKQETNQTATTQNKLNSFFSNFKSKLEQAKGSTKGVKTAFSQLPRITQNVTNNIKNMSGKMKQGLGHVLKYVGALFSIRGIYRLLSSSAQAWLGSQNAQAQQLSANIEYMKYAMGSVFAPVIQYVTNLVYNLMKAVQSLVYALSGVNIFAKATASSMKNTAGSAKQASKSLAGVHNEINNVSEKDNGGSGGSISPNMDLSKIDNTPNSIIDAIKRGNWYEIGETIGQKLNEAMAKIPWDKIKEGAKNIGTNIAKFLNGFIAKTNWEEVGNTFAQGINTVIELGYAFVTTFNWKKFGKSIGQSINGFFKNIDWKKTAQTLSETIKGLLDTAFEMIKEIDWQELARKLEEFIGNIDWSGVVQKFFRNIGAGFAGFGKFIGTLIADAFSGIGKYFDDKIQECGGNVVAGILKGIGDAIAGIGQWIYDNIFKPFIDGFKAVFGIHSPSTVMQEQGSFIIEGLFNGINSLVGKITEIWNNIKQTASDIFNNIKNTIVNIWNTVINTTSNVWNTIKTKVKQGAQGAWNAITSIFGNVSNWFKDKFSKAWQAVKNVFSTGGKIFDGIKDGILKGLKTIVNAIINGINKVISVPFNGLNSALRAIKNVDILGVRPFNWINTIGVPQIPRLAKGGIIDSPTIAMMGEYSGARSNPEIATPQNVLKETFEEVLSNHEWNNQNNSNGELKQVVFQFGSYRVAMEIEELLRRARRQNGTATVTV